MWTIIKSVLRFFRSSKLSIIGLFLLIFFSTGIFTVLNNTSINLKKSYETISVNGNLHDFVINENFSLGYANYQVDGMPTGSNGTKTQKYKPSTLSNTDQSDWTNSYEIIRQKYYKPNQSQPYEFSQYFTFSITYKNDEDRIQQLSDKLSALANFTSTQIKVIYDDELKKLPVSFRRFTSLNINNTKQNIFYKLVESSTDYQIDKLVYYRNGLIYNGNDKLSKPTNIYNLIFDGFNEDTKTKSRLLAEYLYKTSWSDLNTQKQFEALWTYTKANPNFNPYAETTELTETAAKNAQNNLKNLANFALGKQETNNKDFINNKIYNITFTLSGSTAPITGKYEDFTSYEIVVSPDYLSKSGKKIFSYEDWRKHVSDTQKDFDAWFQTIPDTYKVYIDSTPYIIIGTGISPDFMYPVVSFANVVPNKDKEQVVYTNNNGYERIYDAFRGNETEAFIVGKFNNGVTNKQAILNQINTLSTKYMSWPTNIKAGYMFDDTSNTLSPTALRVQFVPQIVRTVSVVSAFLTTFVLALSVFVSTVIIRRFIDNNRNSLGIMQANGYKKVEVIFAICVLVGIPTVLGSVIGYTIGFLLQWKAILLLDGFWTVPTLISPFSIALLLGVCISILVLFLGICILFSWLSLRGETSEFMKDDAKYKMSRLSEYMKKPFKQFSIMTRFKSSVAFLSLWRLIILSVMSSALMLSLTFSLASYDKFDYSAKKSFEPRNYLYSLNLTTPTVQGGQYYAVPYTAQGMSLNKKFYFNNTTLDYIPTEDLVSQNYLTNGSGYSEYANDTVFPKLLNKYGNYQLVSSADNNLQKTRIDYLTNNTTTKALADINLGLSGSYLSANPWSIAERLMPSNNANYANASFTGMFEKMITDTKKVKFDGQEVKFDGQEKTYKEALMSFTKDVGNDSSSSTAFYDANTGHYRVFDDNKIVNLFAKINMNFIILVLSAYENPDYAQFSYNINYNKIIVNNNDEPYTYVNFNIQKINGKDFVVADSLNAIGIDKNTKRISLKNENDIQINNKLDKDAELINNIEYYPIIINEFTRKEYGLNIGDTLEVKVSNTADRFSRQYYEKDGTVPDVLAHFKVVDVTTTYQGNEFFISRYDANKILGLEINNRKIPLPTKIGDLSSTVNWSNVTDLPRKNQFVSEISGFNGIFSTNENLVEVTQGVSLYSPSGIYAAVDKIENNATVKELFAAQDGLNKANYEKIKDLTGFDGITSVDTAITVLSNIFGQSSSFTILSQADSRNSLFAVFENLTTTTNNVQLVVLSIIIIVSLLIVILISSMIIGDSIKLASILKCLGYPDDKNAGTFLAVYFPVFLLGLIISIPFSLLINFIYVNIIFHFAGILLVMPFVWWHYVLSASSVIIIFLCSYWIAWYRIKKMNLTRAIK